ncbi:MAG: flavodoxin family protein [Tindallia sp. MSAO_Bac2]|nr:MAG: flavodoxin family protein [Tindallia sp. MSAO_Bac2]
MKMLIHDLEEEYLLQLLEKRKDIMITSNNTPIQRCIGCFGCWVKTPAYCVLKDEYSDLAPRIAACNEVILISRCTYGGYSPFVKNVLDRSIGYIHPDFTIRKGEMHHKSRYPQQLNMTAHFYGEDLTPEEKKTATDLVQANGLNLNTEKKQVFFYQQPDEMKGRIL